MAVRGGLWVGSVKRKYVRGRADRKEIVGEGCEEDCWGGL